jgi:hypothetical protein
MFLKINIHKASKDDKTGFVDLDVNAAYIHIGFEFLLVLFILYFCELKKNI